MPKRIIILLILAGSFVCNSASSNGGPNWLLQYEQALEKAREENKPILISFAGSDWCKPCIKLTREVFDTGEFVEYSSGNLILLLVDFPRLKKNRLSSQQANHNDRLAQKYNREGVFPLVVLINSDEKIIGETGYLGSGPESYVKHLKSLIDK